MKNETLSLVRLTSECLSSHAVKESNGGMEQKCDRRMICVVCVTSVGHINRNMSVCLSVRK